MAKQITVSFDNDVPEKELEQLREKIRMVLRGEAVPEPEVVGQSRGGIGGGSNVGNPSDFR